LTCYTLSSHRHRYVGAWTGELPRWWSGRLTILYYGWVSPGHWLVGPGLSQLPHGWPSQTGKRVQSGDVIIGKWCHHLGRRQSSRSMAPDVYVATFKSQRYNESSKLRHEPNDHRIEHRWPCLTVALHSKLGYRPP
jgi:hypothetical protein